MNTYTFTSEQLCKILEEAITIYDTPAYFQFNERARIDRQNAIDAIMTNTIPTRIEAEEDDAKRLENSLPLVDEDGQEWTEPKREYRKIPADYGYATCEFCPEPTDAEFIIFADGIAESEVCSKHVPADMSFYDMDEESDEFDYDGWYPEHVLEVDDLEFDDRIPFRGEPTPYNDDNNISPAAIGLEPAA